MRTVGATLLLIVLAIFSCQAMAGEKDKKDDKKPTGKAPATPKDAVTQAMFALADGDETQVFAAIRVGNDDQKELLRAVMALNKVGLKFRDAFIKAYGEKAWETFQDPNPNSGPKDGNATLTLMIKDDLKKKLDKVTIEEKGDEAFARFPADKQTTKIVKMGDGWMMDFEGNFVPSGAFIGAKITKMTQSLQGLAKTIEKYHKAIGAKIDGKEIGPEDIDAELGRAIFQELTGKTTDTPHRFDIEKVK